MLRRKSIKYLIKKCFDHNRTTRAGFHWQFLSSSLPLFHQHCTIFVVLKLVRVIYNDCYEFSLLYILTGTSKPVRWHKGGELNAMSLAPAPASLGYEKDNLVCLVAHYVSLCRRTLIYLDISPRSTLNLSKLLPRQLRFESHR